MTNWITRLNASDYNQQYDAIQIVNKAVSYSARQLGFQELNITGYPNVYGNPARCRHIREAVLGVIQPGDLVVVQFPMWMHLNFQAEFFDAISAMESVRMVALIHDIPTWMFTKGEEEYDCENDFWLKQLKKFDMLMVANEKEAHKLQEDGVDVPMIQMQLWDYLYSGPRQEKKFRKKLYYVGGRDIIDINYQGATPLYIYDKHVENRVLECGSVTWLGRKPSDEIVSSLDGGFGIVVSENLIEKSNMNFVYYNQFNNPTKLSVYLAAGIPVIVPSKTYHAKLVREHGIGLVVDDLNEIDAVLAAMTAQDYQKMLDNIKGWQEAVSEGFFIKRAFFSMLRALELGFTDDLIKNEMKNDRAEGR